MMTKKNLIIAFLLFFSLLFEWRTCPNSQAKVVGSVDFQFVAPENNGFAKKPLKSSVSKIGKMTGVYGVIVIHNGYLSVEQYFREGAKNRPHNLKSASKSVLSALVGIAIDKGYLQLDQPISDFLPFIKNLPDPHKNKITVEHLLSMKSGLQSMSYQAYNSWVINKDWLQKLLKLPIVAEPGTKHQYSTGDSHILSAVLTAATGMSTKEFATKYLFGPMYIEIKGWEIDPQGIYQGGNNLSLYPTDIARFGQLYLDGGQMGGEQIVPNWWVKESTKELQPKTHKLYGGYGYLWYSHPEGENAFVAVGYGGQYIYVSPKYHTVIVIISTLTSKGVKWEDSLFKEIRHGILASIKDSGSKSPDVILKPPLTNGITTTTLNLRKGPRKKSLIIKTIEPGHILAILKKEGAWLLVDASGQKGWVASRFINIVQPENFAIVHQATSVPKRHAMQSNQNSHDKQLEITLKLHDSALQKLQKSQAKNISFIREYKKKQDTLLVNLANQKKAIPPIKKQLNNLIENNKKTIAAYTQLKVYLDQVRLGFDQIESRSNSLTENLKSLQGKRKQFVQDQAVELRVLQKQRQQDLTDISTKLDHQNNVLKDKNITQNEEINNLGLLIKQQEKQQGVISAELATIKGHVTSNTLALKDVSPAKNDLKQIKNDLLALEHRVKEDHDSSIDQLQTKLIATGANQRLLTTDIAKLRRKVDYEKLGEDRLTSEIAALKISLKSLFSTTKHMQEDLLAYENKSKTLQTTVLPLPKEAISPKEVSRQLPVSQTNVVEISPTQEIDKLKLVSPFISSWKNAWSSQDVARYISHYSENFKPSNGMSLKEWQANRQKSLQKPTFITIKISNLTKEMFKPNRAKVIFDQSYQSNSFSDHVTKTILLTWYKDNWQIISEKSITNTLP